MSHYQQDKEICLPLPEDLHKRTNHRAKLSKESILLRSIVSEHEIAGNNSPEAFFDFVLQKLIEKLFAKKEGESLTPVDALAIFIKNQTDFPGDKLVKTQQMYDAYDFLYELCQLGADIKELKSKRQAVV